MVTVAVAVGWYQNDPTTDTSKQYSFIVGLMDGSCGEIPGRNNKSAAAAGTSVDEDPDEDVARTATGCVSNAATSGGDEEANKKKNTVEGAFIVARNTTGCVSNATTFGGDEEKNEQVDMNVSTDGPMNAVAGTMMDGRKIPGSSDNSAAVTVTTVDTNADGMDEEEDVANTTVGGAKATTRLERVYRRNDEWRKFGRGRTGAVQHHHHHHHHHY